MYAIVEIAGLQYKVEKDRQLYVNRLQGEPGTEVVFDRVLLTDNGSVQVGAPVIEGMTVTAKILEHVKGDKVIVFKKKRRKGYRVKNGHRQQFTKIEVMSIAEGKVSAKKAEKKETPKAEPAKLAEMPAEELSVAAEPKVEIEATKKEAKKSVANPNSDHKTVNFGEDHELNYHLKKNGLSQSKANRETLTELGNGLKEELNKRILTHEEVDELISKNMDKFDAKK
ncbi:MAG: 50S ribosomal protein L21 [Weeksellaceae bacterium]